MPSGIKRFLLWDYRRGVWQYDLMVALILLFIFATPREYFRDQPRAANIVLLPSEPGTNVYWIEPELVDGMNDAEKLAKVGSMLKARYGKAQKVVRVDPIQGSEQEVRGYMAYAKP